MSLRIASLFILSVLFLLTGCEEFQRQRKAIPTPVVGFPELQGTWSTRCASTDGNFTKTILDFAISILQVQVASATTEAECNALTAGSSRTVFEFRFTSVVKRSSTASKFLIQTSQGQEEIAIDNNKVINFRGLAFIPFSVVKESDLLGRWATPCFDEGGKVTRVTIDITSGAMKWYVATFADVTTCNSSPTLDDNEPVTYKMNIVDLSKEATHINFEVQLFSSAGSAVLERDFLELTVDVLKFEYRGYTLTKVTAPILTGKWASACYEVTSGFAKTVLEFDAQFLTIATKEFTSSTNCDSGTVTISGDDKVYGHEFTAVLEKKEYSTKYKVVLTDTLTDVETAEPIIIRVQNRLELRGVLFKKN